MCYHFGTLCSEELKLLLLLLIICLILTERRIFNTLRYQYPV